MESLQKKQEPRRDFINKWPQSYPLRPRQVKKKHAEKMPIPKGPRSWKPGDSLYDITRYTTKFFLNLQEEYGKAASFYINGKLYIGLFDPKMVEEVYITKQQDFIKGLGFKRMRKFLGEGLLTSEDPIHKRHRRMMQPPFHKAKIDSYLKEMYDETMRHIETWSNESEIELGPQMMRLTLQIVSQTLFGTDATKYSKEISQNLDIVVDRIMTTLLPSLEALDNAALPWFKEFKKSSHTLMDITDRIIEERRENPQESEDLLGLLIELVDEDGEKFTNEELRDEALTIMLSGHETTATLMIWALARLSTRKDIVEKIREELKNTTWIQEQRPPSMGELMENKEVTKIIKETLRTNPPVWLAMRQAVKDTEIGGVFIPKGANVFVSQYVTHRNKEYYTNPLKWDPERWEGDFEASLPKGAYFPFGYGARKCIGEQFGLMEAKIALMCIVNNYDIEPVEGTRGVPRLKPRATLRAKGNVPLKVTKIKHDKN
jgi:cytochrome P450